jgi:hypothetical protein
MSATLNRLTQSMRDVPPEQLRARLMRHLASHPDEAKALRTEMGIVNEEREDVVMALARVLAKKSK